MKKLLLVLYMAFAVSVFYQSDALARRIKPLIIHDPNDDTTITIRGRINRKGSGKLKITHEDEGELFRTDTVRFKNGKITKQTYTEHE